MITRRVLLALLCAPAGCSTAESLANRPLSSGVSRTFAADFASVSDAVDAAMERLPVNIMAPFNAGSARVVRFERPVTSSSWGESGRVVISAIDANTTRVTVAVHARDLAQPLAERNYAQQIFRHVQRRLTEGPVGLTASGS